MKEFIISEKNEGQRLLRFCEKILPQASRGFLYQSLRKKNIDCNGKKCTGADILAAGDVVRVWFSEETFEKFSASRRKEPIARRAAKEISFPVAVVYEDDDVLIANKPRGMPTQRDDSGAASLNDWLLSYVGEAAGVRPSACHRLDRNTEGLVVCGKTVRALRLLSDWIAERKLQKFYRALLFGRTEAAGTISTRLLKDTETNTVAAVAEETPGALPAATKFRRLSETDVGGAIVTEIEAELLTGRAHQIRVHLASIGHPLLGDVKYGTKESIALSRRLGFSVQALSATRLVFPETDGFLAQLSGREFSIAPDFSDWLKKD